MCIGIDKGYIDEQLGILRLWFRCFTGYVISTCTHSWQVHSFEFQYKCITGKCILPFYKRPGQKQLSFVAWNVQGNFRRNQGNLVESFLKIAFYLTFPYQIPYKILHLYLPEMSVRMTYPSHPHKICLTTAGIEPTTFVNFWIGKNISGVGSFVYERPYVLNVAEKACDCIQTTTAYVKARQIVTCWAMWFSRRETWKSSRILSQVCPVGEKEWSFIIWLNTFY